MFSFREAYKVATLGVPMNDWKALGLAALEGLDFETARKSFSRTKSLNFLRLIDTYEVFVHAKFNSNVKCDVCFIVLIFQKTG